MLSGRCVARSHACELAQPRLPRQAWVVRATWILGCLIAASGCRDVDASNVTGRLWITGLPTRPDGALKAFATGEGAGRVFGVAIDGSAYRGHYDVFEWTPQGKGRAQVTFLQDKVQRDLHWTTCEAPQGFHMCIALTGLAGGPTRYISRKRWTLKRSKGEGTLDQGELASVLQEVASGARPFD